MESARAPQSEVETNPEPARRPTRGSGLLEPFLARLRARKANRLIPAHLRSGRILDVGCGSFPYFLSHTEFAEKFALDQAQRPAEAPSGVDPAAEEAMGEPLEERLLVEHLQHHGLDRIAQASRAKARELFREKENEAWLDRWRRIAGHLVKRKAAAAQLREAEQAFAADGTEENWQHFLAARQHHQDVAASESG